MTLAWMQARTSALVPLGADRGAYLVDQTLAHSAGAPRPRMPGADDTHQARALMKYLTTAQAQDIWVKRGGGISPNNQVAPNDYPDSVSKNIAQSIVSAKTVRFDAGDLMPAAIRAEYWKDVLDYVNDPSLRRR